MIKLRTSTALRLLDFCPLPKHQMDKDVGCLMADIDKRIPTTHSSIKRFTPSGMSPAPFDRYPPPSSSLQQRSISAYQQPRQGSHPPQQLESARSLHGAHCVPKARSKNPTPIAKA